MPTPATALRTQHYQKPFSLHPSPQSRPNAQFDLVSSDQPNHLQHSSMDPVSGLLNHPSYPFSHDTCSARPAYSCYSCHDHDLPISSPPHKPILVPDAIPESSSNTFSASHKAHRSLRVTVEKPEQNPSDSSSNQPFHSTHWMQSSAQPDDLDSTSNFNKDFRLDRQPSTSTESNLKNKETPAPSGAYRTRSLVHHLVNLPHPSEPEPAGGPSNSSTCEPCFGGCLPSSQFGPSCLPNQFELPSSSSTSAHELRSALNSEEPHSGPDDPRLVQSAFISHRTKEGLPSNSHHLLNSPELKTAHINQLPRKDATYFDDNRRDQPGADSGPQSLSNPVTQPATHQHKSIKSTTRLSSTTPQKGKANPNHQVAIYSTDPSDHPPSEDAASILLELSRHEPPKHGMSLRRGRGGPNSRPDPPRTGSCDEKPPIPLTPSGRRYRTRSQIHEEAALKEQNQINSAIPIVTCAPKTDSEPAEESLNIGKRNPNPVPLDLGYGLPTGCNQGLISASGSTNASACTSRSSTGDGSSLSITPAYESNLTLHHFKPHGNFPGRLHLKLSGGSTGLSMAHSNAHNSAVPSGAAFMDDDAKSSLSISTQATSLVSPLGYFTRRTFPPEVPIDLNFPRLYRTFFVPSAFGDREPIKSQAESYKIPVMKTPPNSNYNTPAHGYLDLYTPRYVKGVGAEKLGLCCICAEPKERGGEDTALWLKMKVSSYSYHLSFFHGINNADGLPFSPPVEIRHVKRCHVAANEKLEQKEGRCHHCNKWVPMEGVKMQEVKVPELFWWKHAKSCHKSRLAGECDVHIPDEIYDLVTRQQPTNGSLYNGSGGGSLPASSCSTPYSHYNLGEITTSNSPYATRYPASPAPTCSSLSQSGGSRVHPSVAAQRASAGRVYKRKASSSSLGRRRRDSSTTVDQSNSPQSSVWQPWSLSAGMNSSTGGSTTSIQSHQHLIQHPPSPTPLHPNYPVSTGRKTRRSNMLN